MAKIDQFSRLIHHRITTSGQQFTVPASNDHSDDTWSAQDLYIGEIGINVTDDTMFFRTNNGIIQVATGTSSTSGASSSTQLWNWSSPYIEVGPTYSPDAITPRSGYYTDLGANINGRRFRDVYLGGNATGYATIHYNQGMVLSGSSNAILTTNGIVDNDSPLVVYGTASSTTKTQVLHVNSTNSYFLNQQNSVVTIASQNVSGLTNSNIVAIAADSMQFDTGVTGSVHLGKGMGKTNYNSGEVVAGGQFAVRGIADDGSTQYYKSDWTTSQAKLRTSNATTTNIVNIPWTATASGGDVIQVKAWILATDISLSEKVYCAEIMGCYSINGSLTVTEVGVPVIGGELSSWSGSQPTVEMEADGNGVYIKVKGRSADTIQWLCTYSYHRFVNVIP